MLSKRGIAVTAIVITFVVVASVVSIVVDQAADRGLIKEIFEGDGFERLVEFNEGVGEIKLEKVGEYMTKFEVRKEGYLPYDGSFSFDVVGEKKEHIYLNQICDLDGVCEEGEDARNCPQDCIYGEETIEAGKSGISFKFIVLLGLLVAILAVGVLIFISYRKRNRGLNKFNKVKGSELDRKARV